MKKLTAIIFVFVISMMFSTQVYAGPCGDYEYAELKDMDQETLLKTYCDTRATTQVYGGLFNASYSNKAQRDFTSCHDVMMKIERAYLSKFKIDNRETLIGMCKK